MLQFDVIKEETRCTLDVLVLTKNAQQLNEHYLESRIFPYRGISYRISSLLFSDYDTQGNMQRCEIELVRIE